MNRNSGNSDRPPKPWESAAGASGGPTPFKPPSPGSTGDTVDKSGTSNPGEVVVRPAERTTTANVNSVGRPIPRRPWEQPPAYGSAYGAYGSGYNNYASGLGSGAYGHYGGGAYGGGYGGGGLYGNNLYRSGMYGGPYGGSGMYGGGYGGGRYGMGMGGGPYEGQDPNNPSGPPSPPGFWITFLRVMEGVVNCFGRISVLIDQNTQAFHLFMTALLQVFDRSGMLYWEMARLVLRLLGVKTKPKKETDGAGGKTARAVGPTGAVWDNLWGHNSG